MPMNTITINTDTLEFNPEASATRFEIPLEANAPVFLRNPGYATIPANYRANHLWLKVSVNGQPPADFIYDTGASVTVIDSAYAQKLGIQRQGEFQGQGAGAAGSASLGELSVLRVLGDGGDGIEMKNLKVGILGVNHGLAEFFWRDCAGILGFDVLNRFVNEIDYDRGVLTLRDPKTYQYEGKGATLPFTLSGHVPVVKFKLDGQYEGEARLDVGSGGSLDLHGPFWKKHDLKAKAGKTLEVTGGGFGGTFKNYLARAKRLEVGPYGWDAPTISFFGAETGALASEDFAGNFGNRVFDRFKLTIDYERRQIHLEPGARYADPFRFSRFGGQLMMQDGKVKVGEALPGSPAARAGLVAGDVILSINGQDPRELDLPGVTQLFENTPAGAKVEIEFTHGTKKIKKSVKLEDLI
jgi:hypothetical protein